VAAREGDGGRADPFGHGRGGAECDLLAGSGAARVGAARSAAMPASLPARRAAARVGGIPVQTGAQPLRETNTDQNKPNKY
jgi:hypothetical protein